MRTILPLALAAFLISATSARSVDFNPKAYSQPESEVFVSALQRFVTMKDGGHNRMDRTRYKPTSFALAWKHSDEHVTYGVSASYEIGKVQYRLGDFSARVRDRMFGFTLFGEARFDYGYYAKASAFLGFANQKLNRGNAGGVALSRDGSTSSTRVGASLELGKVFELADDFRITPHVGFDYSYYPGKPVKFRTDAGDHYNIPLSSDHFYEIPFGVSLGKDFQVCDWIITPSIDATVVTSLGKLANSNRNARPGFASRTGSEWKVYGIAASTWGGRITAGVKAVKVGRLDIDVNYAYEGRKSYHDHRLSAVLGLDF